MADSVSEKSARDDVRQRNLTSTSADKAPSSRRSSINSRAVAEVGVKDVVSVDGSAVDENVVQVPRTISLLGGISFIVGTIIGSGIFISPKGVAEGSGSVGFCLVNWVICGIISMLGAFCYAEMGTIITESGADYAFLQAAFGPILSYMFSWVFALLIKPADIATKTLTCSQYILVLLFDDGCGAVPLLNKKLLAITVLMILVAFNVYSIRLAARVQIIFMMAKLLALVIIIIGGIVMLCKGNTQYLATGFDGTLTDIGAISLGFYSGMFAYDGWNCANFIVEEIKNPERNLVLAIVIGVPLVIVAYVMTNVSYFTVMSIDEMIASSAVAITWANRVIPNAAWIIPIFVALSTFGSSNGSMFAAGRLMFVSARHEHLPGVLGMVHVQKYTPVAASMVVALISAIFMAFVDVSSLIQFTGFLKWVFYGINMISFVIFRVHKKFKHIDRPFRVPIFVPFIVFLAAIFIVVVPIVVDPQIEFLFAAIFIAIGYIFYVPFVHFKLRFGCMLHVTKFFQMFLQVSTPVHNE